MTTKIRLYKFLNLLIAGFGLVAVLAGVRVEARELAAQSELLSAKQAFAFTSVIDHSQIWARWKIADGYYMYRQKMSFALKDTAGREVPLSVQLPAGKIKSDPSFGEVEVYTDLIELTIPAPTMSSSDTLIARGQGCNEPVGVCYPPISFEIPVTFPEAANASGESMTGNIPSAQSVATAGSPKRLWWILLTAFAAGIGLTFTPCVLPLIPILSSMIAGQGKQLTRKKAALVAGAYVLGTAVTYAAIGAVAGATGDQLQAYFQNAWAIGIMALVFFVMAMAMFGLFTIQMPAIIQSRLSVNSSGLHGGTMSMSFLLGLISALIVGACVSPVLISFLGLAIAKGSAALGAGIMFSMALGMGVPLILLAVGAGHLLPKAGVWMDKVKYSFGVLLLGVAIYLLSVLPDAPVLYLWAALFIVIAIYLGATEPLPNGGTGWQKLFKGIGTLVLFWGGLALVGALYGERNILHPLPERLFTGDALESSPDDSAVRSGFIRVDSMPAMEQTLILAKAEDKLVLIDFYADWCLDCTRLEQSTFADKNVRQFLEQNYLTVKIDLTDPESELGRALKKRYGVFGPPAVLFVDPDGKQLVDKSFYGYKDPDSFLAHIRG